MRKARYSEEQIIRVLQEVESGRTVKEVCREYGIASGTYYNWKAKYGGMSTSDLRRLKETEIELSQYKKMYAELAHENYALKDLIEKKL